MNQSELNALTKVVDYLWSDESKHYEQEDKPKDHIFHYIKILADYGQVHQFTLQNAKEGD